VSKYCSGSNSEKTKRRLRWLVASGKFQNYQKGLLSVYAKRGPGFLAGDTGSLRKRDYLLTREGGGVGEEPKHYKALSVGQLTILRR
jgi:hypothetical protein